MNTRSIICSIFFLVMAPFPCFAKDGFVELEPGLFFGEFKTTKKPKVGDTTIQVVRMDPKKLHLEILTVSGGDAKQGQSARSWAKQTSAFVATNAGMFQRDMKTAVGHLKSKTHLNRAGFNHDKMLLAFDGESSKSILLADKECNEFPTAKQDFGSLLQGIRMISCQGVNVWAPQKKEASHVAVGTSKDSHILLIFCRSPFSTYDFIEIVKSLPIQIDRLMYLEGGPPAQLYLNTKAKEHGWLGSYSTGSNENDDNMFALPFPNALVIRAN